MVVPGWPTCWRRALTQVGCEDAQQLETRQLRGKGRQALLARFRGFLEELTSSEDPKMKDRICRRERARDMSESH